MIRFGLFVLFATLSTGLIACGSSESSATGGSGGNSGGGGSSSSSAASSGGSSGGSSSSSGGSSSSSSAAKDPLALLSTDNLISGGWSIDVESNQGATTKPMSAKTHDEGGLLIDGGIEPFYADGYTPKLFIWQNYMNKNLKDAPVDKDNPKGATVSLYLFQMPSVEQATGMYKNLLKFSEYTRKVGTDDDWKDTSPVIGDASRIQDSGADWWINFRKGVYYVEVKLTPSNGPAPDFDPGNVNLKEEALRFSKELATKL